MSILYAPVDHSLSRQLTNNRFQVYVGVQKLGEFTKVSGVGYSVEPHTIEEGGRNHSAHYRPFDKPGKFSEVELTWGAVDRNMMESWIHIVSPGYPFRRTVFVIHLNRRNEPCRLIQLNLAWPKEWKVGDFDASGNEIATESLTLVSEFVFVMDLSISMDSLSSFLGSL